MNGAASASGNPIAPGDRSEGQPALSATPFRFGGGEYVNDLAVDQNGAPYFVYHEGPGFLWKIDSHGLFQRVAGKWGGSFDNGANPLESQIGDVRDFTLDRNGALTMLTQPPGASGSSGHYSLRRIGPAFPGFEAAELRVAARDGGEIYVFSPNGLHLRTLDSLTGATNWLFTYNSSHLVTELRDVDGHITRIQRDANGDPTAIVGPYGQRTLLTLDMAGYIATVTDPSGAKSSLVHGSAGLLTSITGPRTNAFTVTYDAKGRATRMSDPLGGFTAIAYTDLEGANFSTLTTNALGDESLRVFDLAPNGSSRAVATQEDGVVQTTAFPLSGDQIQTYANGTTYTLRIASDPRFPAQTAVPSGALLQFPGGLESQVSVGRTATLAIPENPSSLTKLVSRITVNGQTFIDSYDAQLDQFSSTTPEGRTTSLDFDSAGRVVRTLYGNDAPVTNSYDKSGRLSRVVRTVGGDTQAGEFTYNANGLLETSTDPLGRTIRFIYDQAENLEQLSLTDGTLVGFEFDAEANLTAVTPPGRPKHQFRYDEVGSLLQYSPPLVNTDDTVRFAYDANRNVTNMVLPDGQAWNLERGPGGRPARLQMADHERVYGYSTLTGQLLGVSNNLGSSLSFGYQGSLPVLTRWSGVVTGRVALEFNSDLRLAKLAVNDQSLSYSYDRDGLLTKAGDLSLMRDGPSGRVVAQTLALVKEQHDYDQAGRLTNTVVTVGDASFSRVSLQYDRLKRLTDRIETIDGATHHYEYKYDLGGHLTEVRKDGAPLVAYTYDTNGNRLTRNTETGAYDAQDRLTSYAGSSFVWSRNGYRASRTHAGETTTYNYDLEGNLTSVLLPAEQIDYMIDPIGRRLGRKVNGTIDRAWLWLDQQIVAELDATSVVTKRFVYAGVNAITPSLMIVNEETFFIMSDERGSVRRVINASSGAVAQALDYDEFGRVLRDTNPGFQPFGFTGGLYDIATGLVRLGERDYDSETGQWTARDPIGFAGGQYSLYAYVGSDPINFVDPTGTGPFLGFLNRNRQRAIDAAMDSSPGNNDRFAKALDRYDQSVKAAVLTGQVLVHTGQLLNSIAPGPRGPRPNFAKSPASAITRAATGGGSRTQSLLRTARETANMAANGPARISITRTEALANTSLVTAQGVAGSQPIIQRVIEASQPVIQKVIDNSHVMMTGWL